MKNSISVLIVLLFLVIGCGYELRKTDSTPTDPEKPADNRSGDMTDKPADENEKLKNKVAELEKRKLEEKIESLKKQIDSEKKKAEPPKKSAPKRELAMGEMRVHSPGDGWLALRSRANSGSRLLRKIPHGTVIMLDYCGELVRSGRIRGRWCQTTYRRSTGWVFDYYLRR